MFSKLNFFSRPNIDKINRGLETKYVKKENTSHNSISHIKNTSQKLHTPDPEKRTMTEGVSQVHNTTKTQQIYNQLSRVDSPPALPPKNVKVNSPPALPPKNVKVNSPPELPPRKLKNTSLNLDTQVPIQTKSYSILKPTAYLFNEKGNKSVANSSDFLTAVNSKLKSNTSDIVDILNTSKTLFNNLISNKYLSSRYEIIDNSNFGMMLCNENLLKYNNEKLPANIISGTQDNALRVASQYPKSDEKNMENYLNSLIQNKIDTVYILASDDDIKYNVIKYFENNRSYNDVNVKEHSSKENKFVKDKDDILNYNIYPKVVTSPQGTQEINFVHIPNWKDHTEVDANKLEMTLCTIQKTIDLSANSNSLVHCLGGIGRTMEMLLVERMMNMSPDEKHKTSLEEMVHEVREKRTPFALYEIRQLAELTVFALAKRIPLLKNNSH
ncbi:protein-tyrosine phosphatase family protein [Proteus faecis]|uniref:protein-tyrosine-phosphatase n=1 Tax=Proteus faecis TaxID=2050967 RepID=A0AAW7CPG6_9GAMM|nr:protein-tyrosine phosphatase family protein [Proteus faecis]MDL5168021.1 protein-tyrosine phosphatase family protein [Proteus faecis]MDL5276006.1 protein-tyrosine phosphatase family protein [Proteus faecis]MDL5279573.1 protein-tyrosine phosphatase family protein [Proteus faecis]MDL5308615.1 protein-tyrosine phosphatase family protein [Proteus faecis]MDL5312177.1 protein-tyrosine phosphatase family protein [Proteus faecis]